MGLKICITNISYECVETLEKAFQPWFDIKNGALKGLIDEVYITSSHTCFPETINLGYPLYSLDGTVQKLTEFKDCGNIDQLNIFQRPVFEQVAWTKGIPEGNFDYLVMVGSDECWTIDQIKTAFEYIIENPFDYYKVNFCNFMNRDEYVDDFIVPRIWSMKRRGGVSLFWKDDLVTFNDGTMDSGASFSIVPGFINHWSWALPPYPEETEENYNRRNSLFIARKLAFSATRYGRCSYEWNNENSKLILNEEYYKAFNLPKPIIHKI